MSIRVGTIPKIAVFASVAACAGAEPPLAPAPQAQANVSEADLRALLTIAAGVRDAVDRGEIQLPHLGDDPLARLTPAERRLLLATAARGARMHGRTLEIGCGGECILPPDDR